MDRINSISYDPENALLPYLLFTVGKNIYGISSEYVRSIERIGKIVSISESEANIRGGVLFQDDFIPLIDMRKRLGLDSQLEEFEKTVQPEQRIKDHDNWIGALEKSVQDKTEFTLTDDPHQCSFGRWYYAFDTENNVLKHQLSSIEYPHKAVHNTAKTVKKLMGEGKYEAAKAAIQEMRATHYKTTIHILSTLREIVMESLNELYIVIDCGNCIKGIIVDSVVGVEYLDTTLQIPESMHDAKYIECLGRRNNDDGVILILNDLI